TSDASAPAYINFDFMTDLRACQLFWLPPYQVPGRATIGFSLGHSRGWGEAYRQPTEPDVLSGRARLYLRRIWNRIYLEGTHLSPKSEIYEVSRPYNDYHLLRGLKLQTPGCQFGSRIAGPIGTRLQADRGFRRRLRDRIPGQTNLL